MAMALLSLEVATFRCKAVACGIVAKTCERVFNARLNSELRPQRPVVPNEYLAALLLQEAIRT
jgi:hypothetical protein